MSQQITHWSEDRYWTDALEAIFSLRDKGSSTITLDLNAIEKVISNGDGPAYKLLDAMLSVKELEAEDGYRGAPRLVLALLFRLQEISENSRSE